MIRYRIEVADPHAHLFRVTLTVPHPAAEQVLSLPVWIPGSYLVREFARHLSQIEAWQGTRRLTLNPIDKATWIAACRGSAALTVSYHVYAFDTSVRAAYLDATRGFFNGTSVFLRVQGREDQPHRVRLASLPKGWSVATALTAVQVNARGVGDYEAADYDELVDHPVELGHFWRGSFRAGGVPHEFVVAGAWPGFDGERLLGDAKKICEAQIRLWHGRGKPPFRRYLFLLNAVDDGYGGLEHRASTALICARRDLPRRAQTTLSDGYVTLLGLISHEYFHTWNVKRLRPQEFTRYDYTRENYTQLLWFFEGFTSYYDDLVLRRCGLIDDARYLQLLAKTVNQVLGSPGRKLQSVAEASFDAWIRYYRPDENSANSTVSYYTKGALLALALDLTLRSRIRSPQATLDGVLRRLWALQRPISEADIRDAVAEEAGERLDRELDAWVHGTQDLPLPDLLQAFGIRWQTAKAQAAPALGVRLAERQGSLKVQAVMRGSAAEVAGLAAQDEWLALEGWRLSKTDDLNALRDPGREQTALVSRDQRILSLRLPVQTPLPSGPVTLSAPAEGDELTRQRRARWLDAH